MLFTLGGGVISSQNRRYKAVENRLTAKLIMLTKLQPYLGNKKNSKRIIG